MNNLENLRNLGNISPNRLQLKMANYMCTKEDFEKILKSLKQHNQAYLLAFWDQLQNPQKSKLLDQIRKLDFEKIENWVVKYIIETPSNDIPADLKPPPYHSYHPVSPEMERNHNQAKQLGVDLIAAGKVAPFIVAGGQGTRLGLDGPKGDFAITPLKDKTLFRIFAETIKAVSQKYHFDCPWYIMTSPLNHEQTKEIFRSNHYYGLDKNNIFIFPQDTLPNFGFDGKILLAGKDTIACSPDGHGGSLKALYQSGAIDDMKKRGIEHISYFQVDNPLVNIFDPLFIGLHALENADMSSKAISKTDPNEKVGVFTLVKNKVTVVEYSDLPPELAKKQNADRSLTFGLGSIAVHIINVNFVEKLNSVAFSLPFHRAVKKIPHIDSDGNYIEPAEPNGVKLETFVFDALPFAEKSIILQTPRTEEFAPVKNAAGPDSPQTSKKLMIARAADWLDSAGIFVPKCPDGSPDCLIEIAPSFALSKEDIKQKSNLIAQIKPGDRIYLS